MGAHATPRNVFVSSPKVERSIIRTLGELLPDGSAVELIRLGNSHDQVGLLLWNGKKAIVGSQVRFENILFTLDTAVSDILDILPLPVGISSYGSDESLFEEISDVFASFGGQGGRAAELLAAVVLYSWREDCFDRVLTTILVGPPTSEGGRTLGLLGVLCRHPLRLADLTWSVLARIPTGLRPTLLIEKQVLSPMDLRILQGSSRKNALVTRYGRLHDVAYPKAIWVNQPSSSQTIGAPVLQIAIGHSKERLPLLDEKVLTSAAAILQPKLLGFRLNSLARTKHSGFDVPAFLPPVREVARLLGAGLSPTLQSRLVMLLSEDNEDLGASDTSSLEAYLIEALLAVCHQEGRSEAYVSEVAENFNAILIGRSEALQLGARAIGDRIRALGLSTERLGSRGRGVRLLEAQRLHIHRLARDYSVRSLYEEQRSCPHCITR